MVLMRRLKGQARQTEIEGIETERKIDKKESKKSQRKVCETILVGRLSEPYGIDLTDRFVIDRFGDGRMETGKDGIGGMDALRRPC
jgi:hypothetical protein